MTDSVISIPVKQLFKGTVSITLGALVSYALHHRASPSDDIPLFLGREESSIKFGRISNKSGSCLLEEINFLESPTCEITSPDHLAWDLGLTSDFPVIVSPLIGNSSYRSVFGGEGFLPEESFVFQNSFVLSHSSFCPAFPFEQARRWLKAGPRKNLFMVPGEQKALIIPGEQVVPSSNGLIRELVMNLHFNYGVKDILGMPFGVAGLERDWLPLGPEQVKQIHNESGCYLGNGGDTGQLDVRALASRLIERGVTQVYMLGGLKEHSMLNALYKEIQGRQAKIALCAIPQGVEKDYPVMDSTAGFETAVEGAQQVLSQVARETRSTLSTVSIVTLQGESSGHLAIAASLSSSYVDICLVPELNVHLGPLVSYVEQVIRQKDSCVLVVTPGCLSPLPDGLSVSAHLAHQIAAHCSRQGLHTNIQQVDAQHIVRSKASSCQDLKLACQLAQNSVHGVMAGFTNFSVGLVNRKTSLVPLGEILSPPPASLSLNPCWSRLLVLTKQPSFH